MMLMSANVLARDVPHIPVQTDTQPILLQDLKGQVVYVDFWASWCGPCRKSFPWLNQMQQKYGAKGLKVIAINVDSDRELAVAFLKENKSNFTIGYDAAGELASAFEVQGMPSSFIIDRNGVIRHAHVGFREKETDLLETQIQDLVTEGLLQTSTKE
jgi:cytochrome c biogenesis protein CcmG, thiol:disulfide interchange protein DsbE